ncbi:hypothetical protein PR048_018287 [Dryococelus australis]|uniref:Uncharacterized protein n=1 Tax=Dryococelus australis TaxID=614101 RepID=A0ABQ9HBZ5_9NEOP|nr:hypothetical protein PR048_018287 [Dryococelus australis]
MALGGRVQRPCGCARHYNSRESNMVVVGTMMALCASTGKVRSCHTTTSAQSPRVVAKARSRRMQEIIFKVDKPHVFASHCSQPVLKVPLTNPWEYSSTEYEFTARLSRYYYHWETSDVATLTSKTDITIEYPPLYTSNTSSLLNNVRGNYVGKPANQLSDIVLREFYLAEMQDWSDPAMSEHGSSCCEASSPHPIMHCDIHVFFLPGDGATVAERLACSPPTIANRIFGKWESCRRVFSGSPVSPAPSFRRFSVLTSITLIGSQCLAVKSRPNLFTHSFSPIDGTAVSGDRTHSFLIFPGGWPDVEIRRAYIGALARHPCLRSLADGGGFCCCPFSQYLAVLPGVLVSSECVRPGSGWDTRVRNEMSTEPRRNGKSRGKREIPEKTRRRPAASSGTIPMYENPGATPAWFD